jgi:predicted nucleotidyltransferase
MLECVCIMENPFQTISDPPPAENPTAPPHEAADTAPVQEKAPPVPEIEQILAKAVRHVRAKRGGDLAAIILAGSAARDTLMPHSDVDLLVLVLGKDNSHELVRVLTRNVDIRYLGVSIAEEQVQTSPRLPIILRKAQVLFELESAGSQLLHKAHARFRQGPPPLTIHEKIRLRTEALHWLGKAEDRQAEPAIARHLLSIFLDESISAFYQLRGFWPASPVEHLRFIAQRDSALGDLLKQALSATDPADQLATARRIADHLFKDIPSPARID